MLLATLGFSPDESVGPCVDRYNGPRRQIGPFGVRLLARFTAILVALHCTNGVSRTTAPPSIEVLRTHQQFLMQDAPACAD